jgi:Ni,Fe-hydrogenase I cytochrome b subunit
MWQDKVFAICQLAFFPAMVPALRSIDKPPLSTSAMNAVIVMIIAMTQATLGLWLAVSTSTIIALTWATLGLQKHRQARVATAQVKP